MFKKTIFFLLLLFITQTALAGIDLHHASVNKVTGNNSVDIVEHYIDTHGLEYSVGHQCDPDSKNAMADTAHDDSSLHHHDCHGHTTSFTFTSFSIVNTFFTPLYTRFFYTLYDYSITLNSPQRPPIAA